MTTMRFDTAVRMGQHMKLAPRMIQSMEILQMPLAELQERIEQELESNPTLELASDAQTEGTSEPEAQGEREREWEPPETTRRRRRDDEDPKQLALASAPSRKGSLTEQLLEQWALCDIGEQIRGIGEVIIGSLEADGALRTPADELLERSGEGATPELVEQAIQAVQRLLEPPGVAARSVKESLALQLRAINTADEDEQPQGTRAEAISDAIAIVEGHLEDLAKNRLPKVAQRLGVSLERVRAAAGLIKRLSIAPGRALVEEPEAPVIPDAIVEHDPATDRYIAYLNESHTPSLQINREYALLARDKSLDARGREFVKTNLSNANWLVDAVNQRRRTLLRVVEAVVAAQREYFDVGPAALKPLPMTQVAQELGIHVATVSRAVADKHIRTPRGIVPLRKFFSGGVQTQGGQEVAWDAIKVALEDVIGGEDKSRPLSDEALVDELGKRGIEIARRTVAKYREQLSIPAARLRRAY